MKQTIWMLTLFISINVFAVSKEELYNCKINNNDEFDRIEKVVNGPAKGKCINTANYRSVRKLTSDQMTNFGFTNNDQYFYVANFRHLDKFWVAQINIYDIESVDFQLMALSNVLSIYHGQFRFHFKENASGITLISQEKDPASRVELKLIDSANKAQDFVIALFGARELSHDKEAFKPYLGFNLIGRSIYSKSYAFQSLYDGDQWALDANKEVKTYALNLSKSEIVNLMKNTREMGESLGVSKLYDVLTDNCINFVFQILKQSTDKLQNFGFVGKLKQTFSPVATLKRANLIDSTTPNYLINEFPGKAIEKIELTTPFELHR